MRKRNTQPRQSTASTTSLRRRGKYFSQQGIALVAAAVAVSIVGVTTAEFAYNTNIDYASAANARDDMRGYFLARSGMNLSRLVIKVQKEIFDKYRRYLGDVQLADYVPMMTGAFGGSKEEVNAFAEAIGGIDTANIKGLGLPEGNFDIAITTDDGKINANCANGSANTQKQLELMLTALVMPKGYDRLFEDRDGDGQFTDRAMFVRAIIDYVDRDEAAYGQNGQGEDYGYEGRSPAYKARNNYLDSVEELQLVRGMDDRKWEIFGPAFTIYGGCKVNVAAVTDMNLIAAIIYSSAKNPDDPILREPGMVKFWQLVQVVAQARSYGMMFEDLNSFAEFVKDPAAALGDMIGPGGAQGGQTGGDGQPQQLVQGIELDAAKLGQVARAGNRRTYRVVGTAQIGRVEKKITAVWDNDTQNQNARDPAYARGTWVYWKEE